MEHYAMIGSVVTASVCAAPAVVPFDGVSVNVVDVLIGRPVIAVLSVPEVIVTVVFVSERSRVALVNEPVQLSVRDVVATLVAALNAMVGSVAEATTVLCLVTPKLSVQ